MTNRCDSAYARKLSSLFIFPLAVPHPRSLQYPAFDPPSGNYASSYTVSDMFGAIEAGGTKFVCGVGTGPDDLSTIQIPATSPDATIGACIEFLGSRNLQSVGIASFGPV